MFANCLSAYIIFQSSKRVEMVGTSNLSDFVFCQLDKFHATEISVNKLNLNLNLPRRLVVQEIGVSCIG